MSTSATKYVIRHQDGTYLKCVGMVSVSWDSELSQARRYEESLIAGCVIQIFEVNITLGKSV